MFKIKGFNTVIKDNYYLEQPLLSIDNIKLTKLKLTLQYITIEPLDQEKLMLYRVENFSPPHICAYESLEGIEEHVRKFDNIMKLILLFL